MNKELCLKLVHYPDNVAFVNRADKKEVAINLLKMKANKVIDDLDWLDDVATRCLPTELCNDITMKFDKKLSRAEFIDIYRGYGLGQRDVCLLGKLALDKGVVEDSFGVIIELFNNQLKQTLSKEEYDVCKV